MAPIPYSVLLVQVRTLIRRDGLIRGMYAGYGAFLLRDLPFDAIEFWAFDTLNIRLKAYMNRELNALEQGVCGAVAGAVTGVPPFYPGTVHAHHGSSAVPAHLVTKRRNSWACIGNPNPEQETIKGTHAQEMTAVPAHTPPQLHTADASPDPIYVEGSCFRNRSWSARTQGMVLSLQVSL